MKIYECLSNDHDEVLNLFTDLLSLSDDDSQERVQIVEEIHDALIPHARAEESIFYNSIRALDTEKSEVLHGYTEHAMAETLLHALRAEVKLGVGWRATAEKLRDALAHHIKEEETELFVIGHRLFTETEAEMMGTAFEKMKPEIREKGVIGTTADFFANLMPPRIKGSLKSFLAEQSKRG